MAVMSARLTAIQTFPVKGEPGVLHDTCGVSEAGLDGDRPKKAPVSLVSTDETDRTRANLVVDLRGEDLLALIGSRVRVGTVVLAVTRPAGSCPGTYAEVQEAGSVTVGDEVTVLDGGQAAPTDQVEPTG